MREASEMGESAGRELSPRASLRPEVLLLALVLSLTDLHPPSLAQAISGPVDNFSSET